jgi:hypothetical protein
MLSWERGLVLEQFLPAAIWSSVVEMVLPCQFNLVYMTKMSTGMRG